MIDIAQKIKNRMNSSYWSRGASYYREGYVGEIYLEQEDSQICFLSQVQGSGRKDYDVGISLGKMNKAVSIYCTCPAYTLDDGCKHIAAFARKITNDFIVHDDFSVKDRKLMGFLGEEERSQQAKALERSNFIFSRMIDAKISPHREETEHYRVKLIDEDGHGYSTDLELGLFKVKKLKNGSFSKGVQIFRKNFERHDIPQEYKKLFPFLQSSGNVSYYYDPPEPGISFLQSGKVFIDTLFSYGEVFDADNKKLFIQKSIFTLSLHIADTKNDMKKISLVLRNDSSSIALEKYKLFGDYGSEYMACLTGDNHVIFFQTDLNYNFIHTLNQESITLDQNEYEDLKKTPSFKDIIEHIDSPESLDLEHIQGIPQGRIIIEINTDFSEVQLHFSLDYGGGNSITTHNSAAKPYFVDEENRVLKRDMIAEDVILENIMDIHKISDSYDNSTFFKIVDTHIDTFFDCVEDLIEKDFLVEYKQETKRVSQKEVGVGITIKSGIDFFDAKTTLTLGNETLEDYSQFLSALGKGGNKKYITLENGMTILLKKNIDTSLQELAELGIEKEDIGKNVALSKYNIGLLKTKKSKNSILTFSLDAETSKLKKSLSNFKSIGKKKVPDNVSATLRDYQKVGYYWMSFLETYGFSGILADDMGLGKTLQTLTILQNIYNKKSQKKQSLIVCPTSLVLNWIDETEKFTPDLRVEYIRDSKIGLENIKKDTQVIVVSYGIAANLIESGQMNQRFYYVILDESQNIKNPAAKRTKSICKLKSSYRLALSGTPIENNLGELWSGFHFLMPGFLGSLSQFKAKYMGKKTTPDQLQVLSAKIKPFILRRTKEEVLLELPPKQEEVLKLEMLPNQKIFYTKLKNTFKLQITKELAENGLNKARFKVLDALLKLRQACLMPQLVNTLESVTSESIKLQYIEENIDDMLISGHNLLIFSQFTGFLQYVRNILEAKNITFNYLDGKTKPQDRKKLVDDFNTGETKVFVISLKAGGTGLNLTKADYVIHLDPWWNPAVENQATDRAHRMGQKKTVFVQKLICRDSIEEKILELQEKKKELINDIFSGNFTGSLTKEDIDFIFE